ncbi:reverse transcriptase domain-containing protein [Tanacetum coccineum]
MPQRRLPSARNRLEGRILVGFPFKCFLDAYKGYHQIQMAEEDEEKTAFITNQGIFCYTKMPFGLRNAGATYQRLVDKAFHGQIGRNLEVYVDDLVIKSHTEDEVVRDIEETFKTLRKINMKLNPKKCTFGVEEGMFLAKSAEKSLPFFKTLKKCTKKSDFLWTEEAEAAFRQMKEHIAQLHMLTAPKEQEELIVYLAASKEAVSAILMTEREARPRVSVKGQVLVDFIVERPKEESQHDFAKEEESLPAQVADSRKDGRPKPQSKGRLKTGSKPSKWDLRRKRDGHDKILREGKSTGHTFRAFSIKQVPRSKNKKADALSKMASTSFAHLSKQVLVEELKEKSVNESEVLAVEFGGRNKSKTGQRQQELVGRNFSCTLGTPYHDPISSNGDTPFSLTYGTEAVIPAEIGMPTFRTAEVDVAKNDEALEINLELLEEKREQAAIREAKSKRQMEKYYNTKVRNASFKPGDLVYRSNEASRVEDTGKLGPKWEGPYEVT